MKKIFLILLLMIAIGLVGCASAPVKLQPVTEASKVDLNKYNTLVVNVSRADENVKMDNKVLLRIKARIIETLKEKYPNMRVLDGEQQVCSESQTLYLNVGFIEYKGSMMKAEVSLSDNETIFSGVVEQTFGDAFATGMKSPLVWLGSTIGFFGGPIVAAPVGGAVGAILPAKWEKAFAEKLAKALPF